ncbi:MAG: CoA transferase [Chloroflexota bacterium]|nr:CoA transferase [Chloroflexota bacterium]
MGVLNGLRVLDFSQVWAGPLCASSFGAMGAEVIKIESLKHLDFTRLVRTVSGDPRHMVISTLAKDTDIVNSSSVFNSCNMSKLGIRLNLSRSEAIDIARRLVKMSDVVIEAFRPGVMDRLGLGYPSLKEIKPDIIMTSISGMGSEGPEKGYATYASIFSALGGLAYLTGYRDGRPTEIRATMDQTVAMTAFFATLAALIHRQQTGEGQHIDLSARETITCLVGDAVMDYAMNRRVQTRKGNADDIMAPHGIYPCKGEDTWISIAIANEGEWEALCDVMGNPDWTRAEKFSDSLSRWHNQEDLDRLIGGWTVKYTDYEVMDILQKANIAAVPTFRADELVNDPHLDHRGGWVNVEHPVLGTLREITFPWRLSVAPPEHHSSPLLGEHEEYVYGTLLGMSASEIASLQEREIIY